MTVKKIIEANWLGDLVTFEAHYDRFRNFIQPGTWKEAPGPGEGLIYNLGPHLIDQALVLFGKPNTVLGLMAKSRPGSQVNDDFEIILQYDRLKVSLNSSYLVKQPYPRFALHGTMGSFLKYGLDPQEELLKKGILPILNDWGVEEESIHGKINYISSLGLEMNGTVESVPGNYGAFYQALYSSIRKNEDVPVKPEDAMMGISIIEKAIESALELKFIHIK